MSSALKILKCKMYHFASIICIYRQIEGVLPIPQTVELKDAPHMVDILGFVWFWVLLKTFSE